VGLDSEIARSVNVDINNDVTINSLSLSNAAVKQWMDQGKILNVVIDLKCGEKQMAGWNRDAVI
jgi:hypothetical protein